MKTRFIFETIIGVIGILALIMFGSKGGSVTVLIVLFPFITKKKFDDEDKILFKKVNMYTLVPFSILLAAMFVFFNQQINGYAIRDLCVWLFGFFFLLSHGIMGIMFFMNKK
jgi:hypothetical protein